MNWKYWIAIAIAILVIFLEYRSTSIADAGAVAELAGAAEIIANVPMELAGDVIPVEIEAGMNTINNLLGRA
jgi:hypothetical protein